MTIHPLELWLFPVVFLSPAVAVAWWRTESASVRVQRLVSFSAINCEVSLILLGGGWPSVHSVMALTVLPALVLLGVRMVNPGLLRGPVVRAYLRYAVVVPPAMWGVQVAWLLIPFWK